MKVMNLEHKSTTADFLAVAPNTFKRYPIRVSRCLQRWKLTTLNSHRSWATSSRWWGLPRTTAWVLRSRRRRRTGGEKWRGSRKRQRKRQRGNAGKRPCSLRWQRSMKLGYTSVLIWLAPLDNNVRIYIGLTKIVMFSGLYRKCTVTFNLIWPCPNWWIDFIYFFFGTAKQFGGGQEAGARAAGS